MKLNYIWVRIFLFFIMILPNKSFSEVQPDGVFSNEEHIQYWMKTLETHPIGIIRKQAARQLGTMQNNVAVPSLITGLSDVNDDVRIQAAYSLGRLGDSSAIKPLYELIESNSNTQVQSAARSAIGKINAYENFQRQKKLK